PRPSGGRDGYAAGLVRSRAGPDVAGVVGAAMAEHPDTFTPGQIRTVQRRLKDWRSDVAHKLVFGDGKLAIDFVPIDDQATSPATTAS
ncbi:MAG: hypothetical protein ACRYGP_10760, partial [Janthinobacterium lividum]